MLFTLGLGCEILLRCSHFPSALFRFSFFLFHNFFFRHRHPHYCCCCYSLFPSFFFLSYFLRNEMLGSRYCRLLKLAMLIFISTHTHTHPIQSSLNVMLLSVLCCDLACHRIQRDAIPNATQMRVELESGRKMEQKRKKNEWKNKKRMEKLSNSKLTNNHMSMSCAHELERI